MKNINIFQVIVLVLCAFAAVIAMVMFSLFRADSDKITSPVKIWGTFDKELFDGAVQKLVQQGEDAPDLRYATYVQKSPNSFDAELLESLASGNGPDLVILPYDKLLQHKNKLLQISYETYSERNFQDSFVQGADIFRDKQYIHALPLAVDPLVLYWNRTMFNNGGVVEPPRLWDTVGTLANKLTQKDDAATVFKSAIALGSYDNITHAREILTTLILQAGSPIVVLESKQENDQGEVLYPRSVLNERSGYTIAPAEGALRFYTQFADPTRDVYSWNTALTNDRDMFARGDLAMYIGRASEVDIIRKINPNLNFDIATLPQRDTGDRIVFGEFWGVGVIRNSQYIPDAFTTAYLMTSKQFAKEFSSSTGATPVRRDILSEPAPNAAASVAYASSLWSRAYLEPNRQNTAPIFESMIESVVSGKYGVNEAIQNANLILQEKLQN